MALKPDPQSINTLVGGDASSQFSIDPFFHILKLIPFSFLRPSRLRLKIPSFSLPSAMTVFSLILLTYFMVISGFVYDVIVEPPDIGSFIRPVSSSPATKEELRLTLAEKRHRHYHELLEVVEESVARWLREKEEELEKAKRRD